MINVCIYFFTCLVFLNQFSLFANVDRTREQELQEKLKGIPDIDLQAIKRLFHHIFNFHELGFTLFGDKPISFCQPSFSINIKLFIDQNIYDYSRCILKPTKNYKTEWEIWEKYKHLFKLKKYIFIKENLGVILLNKSNVKKIVLENGKTFRTIIKKFDVDKFIHNIEKGNELFELLARNHELFGILLGFGKYNSHLFQRREDLNPYAEPVDLKVKAFPSVGYASIQTELEDLSQKLCSFNEYDRCFPVITLNRVVFASDPNHPETVFLKKKYEVQRKTIYRILGRKDWFEQILLRLTSEE